MQMLSVFILSIVEGLTEFLPVSSTFHLILTARLLSLPQNDFWKLFEVFIQAGAILAVVVVSFNEIRNNQELLKKTLVAFFPTALIGFVLYKLIKTYFLQLSYLTVGVFAFIGLLFIIIEILAKKEHIKLSRDLHTLTYVEAIVIGVAQALAVVPGVSRAGIVIFSMIMLRFKRDESARFSFLLAIPTVLAASLYDLYKMRDVVTSNLNNLSYLVIGFVVTFVFALMIVRWLLDYLKKHTLVSFGVYRLVVALLVAIFFLR